MDIQQTLKSLIDAGMTQKEIAASIGYTQPHISEILTGKIVLQRPSAKMIDGLKKLKEVRNQPAC